MKKRDGSKKREGLSEPVSRGSGIGRSATKEERARARTVETGAGDQGATLRYRIHHLCFRRKTSWTRGGTRENDPLALRCGEERNDRKLLRAGDEGNAEQKQREDRKTTLGGSQKGESHNCLGAQWRGCPANRKRTISWRSSHILLFFLLSSPFLVFRLILFIRLTRLA